MSDEKGQASSEKKIMFQQYSVLGRTQSDVQKAEKTGSDEVMHFGLTVRFSRHAFLWNVISPCSKPTQQDRVQVATQFLHSVLHPVLRKPEVRHLQENVMKYGGQDSPAALGEARDDLSVLTSQAASGDVRDDESVLTPLPSEYGDEDEGRHKPLDIDEIKASVESLRQYLTAMQPIQEAESPPDFIRPGVQDEGKVDEYSYERTGVTHLVHSWHAQGHKRLTVGLVSSL
jgi:hypothetical protein